ncbi:MAG: hypothetical protein AB7Q42_17385 [Acidimicrobiia bacterium]
MLALEPLRGVRVVTSPEVLDNAPWTDRVVVLRFAPDDAMILGTSALEVSGEHAIVVDETGFVGCWLSPEDLVARVLPHVDWPLPEERPALAQGLVAGVPAKLWLTADQSLLLCAAAYADELSGRLA